jgi:hypothetical protein
MTDTHHGYVAGRYRDGALSDKWTDVTRCAERTFIAYVARCGCGWFGKNHSPNPDGYRICQHDLISNHFFSLAGATVADLHRAVARRHAQVFEDSGLDPRSRAQ